VRRRWEERKDRSGVVWEETGSAAKDEMLAGAVGCGDDEEDDDASPGPAVSAGVEAEPTSGVTVGGAAAPGKNGKNGAGGGGGGSAGVLSKGNSGSCSALLPQ